ncbi:hypothetical protein Moror_2718 [Moniliophthora roreri MCA 2997]|uniref:Uncharacterized protein n=2 Tax=Moniliophthora roreri TaxID=221103 RepID=V2XEV7_MONRO|nr:hypothetical protein Moror_2718 [Moniliophthora roreri MCA 2997]KAI3603445.1 hypothetical protein WG66_014303 [Moniliophthora roreri]
MMSHPPPMPPSHLQSPDPRDTIHEPKPEDAPITFLSIAHMAALISYHAGYRPFQDIRLPLYSFISTGLLFLVALSLFYKPQKNVPAAIDLNILYWNEIIVSEILLPTLANFFELESTLKFWIHILTLWALVVVSTPILVIAFSSFIDSTVFDFESVPLTKFAHEHWDGIWRLLQCLCLAGRFVVNLGQTVLHVFRAPTHSQCRTRTEPGSSFRNGWVD